MIDLLRYIGIKNIKIGIESCDDESLKNMSKRQDFQKEMQALALLEKFNLTGYLIVGDFISESAMKATIERAEILNTNINHWVISVASYKSFGWDERKYDSHFSMRSAVRQGVKEELLWKMLNDLPSENPTVSVCEAKTPKPSLISNLQVK
jgi:hypothetical protein